MMLAAMTHYLSTTCYYLPAIGLHINEKKRNPILSLNILVTKVSTWDMCAKCLHGTSGPSERQRDKLDVLSLKGMDVDQAGTV